MLYTMLGDADCTARNLEPVLTGIGQSNVPVLPTVSADSADVYCMIGAAWHHAHDSVTNPLWLATKRFL